MVLVEQQSARLRPPMAAGWLNRGATALLDPAQLVEAFCCVRVTLMLTCRWPNSHDLPQRL